MGRPKKIWVLCTEDYWDFLTKDFVKANEERLAGRMLGDNYGIHYQKGKLYEATKWTEDSRYVMSDLLFPEDHRVPREWGKKKVKMWQTFFMGRPKGSWTNRQDFYSYFEEIPGK